MHRCYIGMGGNVDSAAGTPEQTLAAAAERLGSLGRVVGRSSLYSTEPVGMAEQPRFVNAVVALETEIEPRPLLAALLEIERSLGRDRSGGIVNGPRTLDLDVLLFDEETIHEPGLVVPHPRLAERAFVVVPLAELVGEVGDVRLRQSVTQWLHDLRRRVEFGTEAVIPLQSTVWRAGIHRDGGRSDARDADGGG